MTSPTPEPTLFCVFDSYGNVAAYTNGVHALEDWPDREVMKYVPQANEPTPLQKARRELVEQAIAHDEALVARLKAERDAALAREAALVDAYAEIDACFVGRDADGAPGADGTYWVGHGAALRVWYALRDSTAAAEARDKKLKDEARREGLEQAAAVVAALALVEHHPDTLWKCHDAIRRAAAAPETP